MKKILPVLFIFLAVIVFFWQFFVKGLLPIPADTIIGLYHPFRDLYSKDYPNGIPFKNFLITDPVRQQYPWRKLVISAEKKFELPLWNPYSFAGTPLLANFQSASFYPLNILFFLIPFTTAWSLIIFLGPLFSGIFLYLYLNNLKLSKWASLLGAITFSFSGFFASWLEWGTIPHVALWLPLILLSIDKTILNKKYLKWIFIYLFSVISSFFAGHLQIFFYLFIFSLIYFLARWFQDGKNRKVITVYLILNTFFLILTAVQWIPTLQLIILSARDIDTVGINSPGWFIPWQHLIQFIAPDFFGNPTTLNYWGVWNYGELVGYVGLIPLMLALFAMFNRWDKKTLFFGSILFLSLIFALPTFFAKIPYLLKIPFLSTSQPTRLLFIIDFALAVLSALGLDYLLKINNKIKIVFPLIFVSTVLLGLWVFIPNDHLSVVKNNLILPSLLLASSSILFVALIIFQNKRRIILVICIALIMITVFDLLRFGWKFDAFTNRSYLFPSTKTLTFLQNNVGNNRIMTTDSRILPPNFSAIYRLQSVDGYDPLYDLRYGELIAASERSKADIASPFGFNRIITPHNYDSRIIDLLGVKYILSLDALNSPKLTKVFQEGQTIIYENRSAMPRAFFVQKIEKASSGQEAINMMFDSFNPKITAVVENADKELESVGELAIGKVNIVNYSENKVVMETENTKTGFLVFTDSFYPTWRVAIDGKIAKIYRTDYDFRGIVVPGGSHEIKFYTTLY